jgi:hypothetical protein
MDPGAHRPLGRAAERMVEERYSLERVVPEMVRLYEQAATARNETVRPRGQAT